MKNCAFVLPTGLDLGGVLTWSDKVSKRLVELGFPATLIRHSEYRPPSQDFGLLSSAQVISCPGKPAWEVFSTDDVLPYISSYSQTLPGTLIPNWSYGSYAACAILSLSAADQMRIIGFAHSDQLEYYEYLTHYESIIHKFVTVSDDIADKLKQRIPNREQDIVTRPYGVDVAPELTRTYSSPAKPIELMYGGRIENWQKRIYDLMNLAKVLKSTDVNFHLKVVGGGDEEAWLRQEIAAFNATSTPQKITFIGSVPYSQMLEHWRSADLCILVSNYEGTSISMLEAMAQGCVPVVTQVSGTAKVIHHGTNGFTVPVGDMEKMADLIAVLASDRNLLQKMGSEAHKTVLEHFSFESYVPWFLDLNQAVWAMPPRPWPETRPLLHRSLPVQPSLRQRLRGKAIRLLQKLHLRKEA